jgi:pyruvate dehydrogenase E1 component beta subunit
METFYAQVPGLWVCAPATPRDAKGLLKTAIRENNPVVFLEGETLYGVKGEVPDEAEDETIPFGLARIAREGHHVTIVSWGRAYHEAMKAADALAKDGIECEVVDPRTLRPLDHETILESVKKTNRVVVAHEHWPYSGPGAEIVDHLQRDGFDHLDAPILRVTGRDVPMPYALNLEERVLVRAEDIAKAVKKVMYT